MKILNKYEDQEKNICAIIDKIESQLSVDQN